MRKAFFKTWNLTVDYKKTLGFLFFTIISFLSVSCNNLPADLKIREKSNDNQFQKILAQEDTAKTSYDIERLITDYTKLSKEITAFNNDCKKRGIKPNYFLINLTTKKLANAEKVLNVGNRYNYGSSFSSGSSSTSSSNETCSWCGKSFSGTHYTHLGKMSDCYSTDSSTSIGIYCSKKCCSEARRSSCPTCR